MKPKRICGILMLFMVLNFAFVPISPVSAADSKAKTFEEQLVQGAQKYIKDRAKQELILYVIDKLKTWIGKKEIPKEIFPATIKLVAQSDQINGRINEVVWRNAFQEDLDHLLENLLNQMVAIKYPKIYDGLHEALKKENEMLFDVFLNLGEKLPEDTEDADKEVKRLYLFLSVLAKKIESGARLEDLLNDSVPCSEEVDYKDSLSEYVCLLAEDEDRRVDHTEAVKNRGNIKKWLKLLMKRKVSPATNQLANRDGLFTDIRTILQEDIDQFIADISSDSYREITSLKVFPELIERKGYPEKWKNAELYLKSTNDIFDQFQEIAILKQLDQGSVNCAPSRISSIDKSCHVLNDNTRTEITNSTIIAEYKQMIYSVVESLAMIKLKPDLAKSHRQNIGNFFRSGNSAALYSLVEEILNLLEVKNKSLTTKTAEMSDLIESRSFDETTDATVLKERMSFVSETASILDEMDFFNLDPLPVCTRKQDKQWNLIYCALSYDSTNDNKANFVKKTLEVAKEVSDVSKFKTLLSYLLEYQIYYFESLFTQALREMNPEPLAEFLYQPVYLKSQAGLKKMGPKYVKGWYSDQLPKKVGKRLRLLAKLTEVAINNHLIGKLHKIKNGAKKRQLFSLFETLYGIRLDTLKDNNVLTKKNIIDIQRAIFPKISADGSWSAMKDPSSDISKSLPKKVDKSAFVNLKKDPPNFIETLEKTSEFLSKMKYKYYDPFNLDYILLVLNSTRHHPPFVNALTKEYPCKTLLDNKLLDENDLGYYLCSMVETGDGVVLRGAEVGRLKTRIKESWKALRIIKNKWGSKTKLQREEKKELFVQVEELLIPKDKKENILQVRELALLILELERSIRKGSDPYRLFVYFTHELSMKRFSIIPEKERTVLKRISLHFGQAINLFGPEDASGDIASRLNEKAKTSDMSSDVAFYRAVTNLPSYTKNEGISYNASSDKAFNNAVGTLAQSLKANGMQGEASDELSSALIYWAVQLKIKAYRLRTTTTKKRDEIRRSLLADYQQITELLLSKTELMGFVRDIFQLQLYINDKEYNKVAMQITVIYEKLHDKSVPKPFFTLLTLATSVSEAKDGDDIAAAFESTFESASSYRSKRIRRNKTISLNLYLGLASGKEALYWGEETTNWGTFGGLWIPVGLEISWGHGENRGLSSRSWLITFLDLGASFQFFYNDRELDTAKGKFAMERETKDLSDLSQYFSPGIWRLWGIYDLPIACGLGVQLKPVFRKYRYLNEAGEEKTVEPMSGQFGITCGLDLPLLIF
ncbi:MAG: hypothetical protein GY866_10885 [Proteobacteria bacterium]|nr:hypothetical protein [Pseudomonadota bacterium]